MTERSLTVEEATRLLNEQRTDALAVLTMSALAYWDDMREDDYKLLGLMGGAGAIGLGIAIGLPERPVWVLDGDGSVLMQLGLLPTVGGVAPKNFVHILLDNAIYSVSGGQPTPAPTDWVGLFAACGYVDCRTASTADELRDAIADDVPGPRAIVVRCVSERPAYPKGAFIVHPDREAARLRSALTPPA